MSQQETKGGAQPETTEFNGSEGTRNAAGQNGAEQDGWKARFDDNPSGAASESQPEERKADAKSTPKDIPLPKVDFATFVLSLASSALVQLGEVPNPETGQQEENLKLAQHTIDILAMLQEKTRNGLSEEEGRLMEGVLYELRMKYVIKSR